MKVLFKYALLLSLLVPSLAIAQSTKKVEGVDLPTTYKAGDAELKLNGAGLRKKFFLKLYIGALYTGSKMSKGADIINADEPMAIKLHIISGLVSSEKMTDAVDEGFENSTKGNIAPFKDKIAAFKGAFSEEIVKNNVFDIAYIPGKGTSIYKNKKFIKTIEGFDFKKALFGIWFCDEPADEGLMEGMLGID